MIVEDVDIWRLILAGDIYIYIWILCVFKKKITSDFSQFLKRRKICNLTSRETWIIKWPSRKECAITFGRYVAHAIGWHCCVVCDTLHVRTSDDVTRAGKWKEKRARRTLVQHARATAASRSSPHSITPLHGTLCSPLVFPSSSTTFPVVCSLRRAVSTPSPNNSTPHLRAGLVILHDIAMLE